MEGLAIVDLGVHKDLSMSLTRKAAVSVAFKVKLTLRTVYTGRRVLRSPGVAYVSYLYGTNPNGQISSVC
jgi:hypothetical protein